MDWIQILGFAAAFFTTAANIPQAYKIIKTRSTKDISTMTYSLLFTGLVLWLVYGIAKGDLPIILANAIAASIAGIILILKHTSKKVLDNLNDKLTPGDDN
ncbi:MAG TPA: SemiSWEET transporter [Flavobacterium sp.]|jgi:MtN3 and saliva related transmembrane protein|nr:SemiSWEET transporter [Flavobacterium sp.]